MEEDVLVKKSKISGKGVFALKDYKKGDIILKWKPKSIKKFEIDALSVVEKQYLNCVDGKYFVMQPPERYVNHSCQANTNAINKTDVAIRDIKKGEEITSDYGKISQNNFKCNCGSKKCKRMIANVLK